MKDNLKIIFIILILLGLIFMIIALYVLFNATDLMTKNTHQCPVYSDQEVQNKDDLGMIKVDISGEIANPGLYKVRYGTRVSELIALAGGFSDQADQNYIYKNLNLAKKLIDEEKVYIFSKQDYLPKQNDQNDQSNSGVESKTSINYGTKSQLMELTGVGEKRASLIIEKRPFQSLDELVIKEILSQNQFDELIDYLEI